MIDKSKYDLEVIGDVILPNNVSYNPLDSDIGQTDAEKIREKQIKQDEVDPNKDTSDIEGSDLEKPTGAGMNNPVDRPIDNM